MTDKRDWTAQELKDFVTEIAALHDDGYLPFAIHLPGGNEEALIQIFKDIKPGDYVFSTHRNWYHALLHGIPAEDVTVENSEARSMFMFDRNRNFFVSAIIGGTPAIAVGVAQALKKSGSTSRVWCFVGDGIEDTGHFAEAVRYVNGFDLPCTFVIEDDNMAVEVSKEFRWGTGQDLDWPDCVLRYKYTKNRPHIRTGNFADISVMKSVMKSDQDYFPKVEVQRFHPDNSISYTGTYKQASTESMTKLGKKGAIFIGYSLVPGDAMGTLTEVPLSQKIEMPIADLMIGMAIGLSLEGFLPVVYFERHDFMLVAMDAIVNHLDKINRISHGEFKPKVILKTVVDDGGLFYSGPTHSQDFTELFRGILEFEVLDAHTAQDLIEMYEFAINTPHPVMIVEHKKYF